MKRYSKYKDSGVEWIGKIPDHWDSGKLKFKLDRNDGGAWGSDFDDDGTFVLRSTEINLDGSWDIQEPAKRLLSNGDIKKTKLLKGDLLITKSSGSEIHIGKTALVNENVEKLNACFSNFMQRIRPSSSQNSIYLHYILNSNLAREQYNYLSQTTTGLSNLSAEIIGDIQVPFLSLSEQKSIANYLANKTRQIDNLVDKKQKQIELLKEQRTAIINHAVTKGLNPNVKMKNSGIEWLGEIPAHWSVSKVKYVCSVRGRIGFRGYTTDDQVNEGEGALTLGATQIQETGKLDFSNPVFISWDKYYESPEIMIVKSDILIVQRGSTCGKIGLVEDDIGAATINPSLIIIKEIAISFKYLFYFLKGSFIQNRLGLLLSSTAIPMLSQEQINNLPIVTSSSQDQQRVVEFLDSNMQDIDDAINTLKRQINTLLEYRITLISDAVTGKMDVRNEVPA